MQHHLTKIVSVIMKTLEEMDIKYRELNHPDSEYFQISNNILKETEKAICFDGDKTYTGCNETPIWIPKSQMIVIPFETVTDRCDNRYFAKNWLRSKFK